MNQFDIDFASLPDSFGLRLRIIRQMMDLRQDDVARSVGVSRSLISAFENETRRPTVEITVRLARTLGVPSDEMLGAVVSLRSGRSFNVRTAPRVVPRVTAADARRR
jgi:transcriptional regulator with XRE-family HTH domain